MLSYIFAIIFTGFTGFVVGALVGSEVMPLNEPKAEPKEKSPEEENLEKKVAMLERTNEDLSEANEKWFEAYERLSEKNATIKYEYQSKNDLLMFALVLISCIVVVSALSIYTNTFYKNFTMLS
jgi:hypothetical protein